MIFNHISDDIHTQMSPHFNALLQFCLKFEHCKPHKTAHQSTKCDIINNVKLSPTVYHRLYSAIDCRKFVTLSNQMSRYKSKCIRIIYIYPHHFDRNRTK